MRRKIVLYTLGLLLLGLTLVLALPARFHGRINALQLALDQPDALIRSHALARLPRDLLQIPLARDVLTEDFVTYYETHEDRLALAGTVRRMAYEHQLQLPDRLVEHLFDEAGEIALWRGPDGSLKYGLLVMTRNTLAHALQATARFLPVDRQLKSAGHLVEGLIPLYILEYNHDRRLLIASKGERVVILSDPGMLLDDSGQPRDPAAAGLIGRLLTPPGSGPSPLAAHFALPALAAEQRHDITVSARYLSLGYQAFAPAIQALTFRFDAQGEWQTQVQLASNAAGGAPLNGQQIWAAAPHGASLCALIPADWSRLGSLLPRLGPQAAALQPLAARLTGPGAVCWYASARLYTPLFLATLDASADAALTGGLETLMQQAIGSTPAWPLLPADDSGDARVWHKEVPSRHGNVGSGEERPFNVTLATRGQQILFSPDAELVERALAVSNGRYPALADSLPDAARTLGFFNPAELAPLLRQEAFAALPADEEAILHNAAREHLLPRLEALQNHPPYRLVLSRSEAAAGGWHAVEWQAVEPR